MAAPTFDGPILNNGRWRLGPKLGAGGQGHTFLARDEKTGAIVCAKQVQLGEAGWKKFDLFQRECRVLRQLRHPGIPRVLDEFEGPTPGTFYLVMDKAPGATLKAISTRARWSDDDLRDLMRRVLDILAYLHAQRPPVIHRDVKPANLLRDADGTVSLVDFGGVRAALRDEGGSTVVGTFGYMAPEQLHGEATSATDLFGLGATIAALASGVEPEKIPRRGLRMDLQKILPQMAPDLRELLEHMTDPDPANRPRSAEEAKARLATRKVLAPEVQAPSATAGGVHPDDDMSGPLGWIMRISTFGIATFGLAAVTVARFVFVPFVFALLSIFFRPERKKALDGFQQKVNRGLAQGRNEFRALQKRAFHDPPRQLPPPR